MTRFLIPVLPEGWWVSLAPFRCRASTSHTPWDLKGDGCRWFGYRILMIKCMCEFRYQLYILHVWIQKCKYPMIYIIYIYTGHGSFNSIHRHIESNVACFRHDLEFLLSTLNSQPFMIRLCTLNSHIKSVVDVSHYQQWIHCNWSFQKFSPM